MGYDIVIRGGTIVDGSGQPGYRADLGVRGGRIARIGRIAERGVEEIDADGHVVTPGFVDVHTHLDAQAHWDPLLTCSSYHGVTTAVMGNCGFTIAPSREGARELVVRNLERAEDISAEAMALGITFDWETFPEYLDVVDRMPKGINCAMNIGHSALRTWAMGEKAFTSTANDEELALMKGQVSAAMQAGAVGFTTSFSGNHETSDNRPVASRIAAWSEVEAMVETVAEAGGGMFALAHAPAANSPDVEVRAPYFRWLRELAVRTGVPISFGVLAEANTWRNKMALIETTNQQGGRMVAQTHSRELTVLHSFKSTLPFDQVPQWQDMRALPLEGQRAWLIDEGKRQILVDAALNFNYARGIGAESRPPEYEWIRVMTDAVNPTATVAELAAQTGRTPVDVMIDAALATDFEQFFMQVISNRDEAGRIELLKFPYSVMSFSDSGAHVSQIMDSSIQTHFLAYWIRQRELMSLEEGIRLMTFAPASAWGFHDRGILLEGMAADINVIDPATVRPELPTLVNDLPGGSRRLLQKSAGIAATIVGGKILMRNGAHTGALPGRLVRGRSYAA